MNREGTIFTNFSPAISDKAEKAMRDKIREWTLYRRSNKSLEDLSAIFSPVIRRWINYYGSFYKSALIRAMRYLNRGLIRWAMRKYKGFKRHQRKAEHWLGRIAKRQPWLFPHWQIGAKPATG